MRILHFSDVHLSNDKKAAVEMIKDRMIEKLSELKASGAPKIELVVFSGDFLDKSGYDGDGNSYKSLQEGLKDFDKIFITPLMECLELTKDRFIMTMGNHEVVRKEVTENEVKILNAKIKGGNLDEFYWRIIGKESIPWLEEFKQFEKEYYQQNSEPDHKYEQDKLASYHTINLKGQIVNIMSAITPWATFTKKEYVWIERDQISNFYKKVKSRPRDINIIVGHNHYQDVNSRNQRVALCEELTQFVNICFSGHTHQGDDKGEDTAEGYTYFNVAPGLNMVNMRKRESDYRNGFMIVDYNLSEKRCSNTWYEQKNNGDFDLRANYGDHGISTKHIVSPPKIVPIAIFLHEKHGDEYIKNDTILEYQNKIVSGSQIIRLSALPGFGKSRLIYEAYNNQHKDKLSRVYYCESGEKEDEIYDEFKQLLQVSSANIDTVIIDDCPSDLIARCSKYIQENRYDVRLVAVNSQPYDYTYVTGCEDIIIEASVLKERVDDYIKDHIVASSPASDIVKEIQTLADGFPYMAILLVDAYNEHKEVRLNNIQNLIEKLLRDPSTSKDANQINAMRTMALFQPMPTDTGNAGAYDYIIRNEKITHITEIKNEYKLYGLFSRTRIRYKGKLIEETPSWLNVRPFPLAAYLVSQWFEEITPARLTALIDEIQAQPADVCRDLREGMSKRIEMMRESDAASDVIARLTSIPNGSFCCEKVVSSEMGSRLFLAMSTVNPEKVAKCLRYIFQDKDTEWIKKNVTGNIRRNLVWALGKLCFAQESYDDAVVVLTQFAEAENESWSNNSRGCLMQLFPIQLPDTEVDLKNRASTIEQMWNSGYKALALSAVNIAFRNGHFTRMGGAEKFGWHHRQPHVPSSGEIYQYWNRCFDLLLSWYDEDKSILKDVCAIAESHVYDWRYMGLLEFYLFRLIDKVLPDLNGMWKKMYELLSNVLNHHKNEYTEEFQAKINDYLAKLEPKLFADTILYASRNVFDYADKDKDLYVRAHEILDPLAKQFVERKIYTDVNEVKALVAMQNGEGLFLRELQNELSEEQLKQLLDIVWQIVEEKRNEFNSSFVNGLLMYFNAYACTHLFVSRLLDAGYTKAYSRTMAAIEDDNMSSYLRLVQLYKDKKLAFEDIEEYLGYIWGIKQEQMCIILPSLMEEFPNKYDVILRFVMKHRYGTEALGDDLHVYIRKLLLETPWVDEYSYSSYEQMSLIKAYLEKYRETDLEFGIAVNKKAIAITSKTPVHGDGVGDLYKELLQEPYQSAIWEEFTKALIEEIGFFFSIQYVIGSGFGFDAGPLFQYVPEERLKGWCEKDERAIHYLANMAPVFKYDTNGQIVDFSDFLKWLLDTYGNKQETLSGISANLHTMSWTGSTISLHEDMVRVLTPYLNHKYPEVREGALKEINYLKQDIEREKSQEDYMRMHYE
jgi:3',5'-cyclic AMP phosphodiesterase CpdA